MIASCCNKCMAVVARKDSPIASIEDLRGRKVAIWPGSTQEVFILERPRMEGMTIKDVEPVRISFSEMHLALTRGDVEAYVGAERKLTPTTCSLSNRSRRCPTSRRSSTQRSRTSWRGHERQGSARCALAASLGPIRAVGTCSSYRPGAVVDRQQGQADGADTAAAGGWSRALGCRPRRPLRRRVQRHLGFARPGLRIARLGSAQNAQ